MSSIRACATTGAEELRRRAAVSSFRRPQADAPKSRRTSVDRRLKRSERLAIRCLISA